MLGPREQQERLQEDLTATGLVGAARSLLWVIILIAAIAAIAHLLWGSAAASSTPSSRDTVNITLRGGLTETVPVKTRIIRIARESGHEAAAERTKQVKLPNGRWIDCHRNCAGSYMRAVQN